MAGMKRFVTYIYGYEDGKKGANVGFAKIEIRGEECRIEIHLRGIYTGEENLKTYLFRAEQEKITGFLFGEMKVIHNNGDLGIVIKASAIAGSPYGIYEMDGLCLLGEDDSIYMSRWKEGISIVVSRENFKNWEPPQLREEEAKKEQKEEAKKEETQKTVSATEIPMQNVFLKYDWLEIWEQLQNEHPVITPFDDKEISCVQIELKDLRELPRRYWYLGNNSFLLHGFFNYHCLIIGNIQKERWFIGIPGIYQRQERVMAAIFGFPEFIPAALGERVGKMDEPINHFGYWYRFIEE